MMVPTSKRSAADDVDGVTVRFLVSQAPKEKEEKEETERKMLARSSFVPPTLMKFSLCDRSLRRNRKKRKKKKKLPRGGARLQGAYAKVTDCHCSTSSCLSGACGKQVLQAFALEATPVFMWVSAQNWKDHTGGVTSDKHPEE